MACVLNAQGYNVFGKAKNTSVLFKDTYYLMYGMYSSQGYQYKMWSLKIARAVRTGRRMHLGQQ